MVTKLKNWIKEHEMNIFIISVILCCVSGMLSRIFIYYRRLDDMWGIYSYGDWVGFIWSAIFCVAFFVAAFRTGKKIKRAGMLEVKSKCKWDKIKSEICALILITGAIVFVSTIFPDGYYIMGNYLPLKNIGDIFYAVIFLSVYSLIMLTDIVLLWRKYKLGILKENSWICKGISNYKNRTDIEKQMWDRKRISLYITIFCLGILTILLVYVSAYEGTEIGVIAEVFVIIMAVIFIKNFCSMKKNREISCLLNHIDALSKGENIDEESELPKNSLFYESDMKLHDIESAVKESAKKQISAERLKMDLITNVSHDLKTPLTSMVAYTDLLKKEELSPTARDYVDAISRKQQQLKEMIQSVFELSKSTSGTEVLKMEVLDMKVLIEQMLADFDERIKNAGFSVKTHINGEKFFFMADNSKMYRVIQNLLENALKYSMEGTRIHVDIEKTGDNKIRLSIKNISSYEIDFEPEEMLERFARADKARSSKGNGLGLAIANSYILNMNGSFALSVDGDLFKAMIEFDEVSRT